MTSDPQRHPTDVVDRLDIGLPGSLGIDELVPAPLAPWRPLVVEAMAFFLQHLPADRLAAIVGDQLALPRNTPADARLVALLTRCPTLHKLGQVLARRQDLHPDLRRRLQALESMPPTVPPATITARVHEELGAL